MADYDAVLGGEHSGHYYFRLFWHYTANGAAVDRLDGLTMTLPDGAWFNLRPSNTEPLLRLNVEASDQHSMTELRQDVLALLEA